MQQPVLSAGILQIHGVDTFCPVDAAVLPRSYRVEPEKLFAEIRQVIEAGKKGDLFDGGIPADKQICRFPASHMIQVFQ